MVSKVDITPSSGIRLRKEGTLNLNQLYKDMKAWFAEKDYIFFEKEAGKKEKETGFKVLIKWEVERNIDEYAQFKIKVEIFGQDLQEIKKEDIKLHSGNFEIRFWADVNLDYTNTWERKPFGKFLFGRHTNVMMKSKIQSVYETKLDDELQDLIAIAKEYFE